MNSVSYTHLDVYKRQVQRYGHWKRTFTQANSRQAVLAFNGDVYEGLEASTLSRCV